MPNHAHTLPPTVLITGASTGIGLSCAQHLAQNGWQVFAGYRKPEDGAALAALNLPLLTPLRLDVCHLPDVEAAAQHLHQALGNRGLQGLVNNAGIAMAGPMEYLPMEELRLQMEVNFFAQVEVTQRLLPLLRQGKGRIVMMSSISGRVTVPMLGPYCASKYALEAVGDALRLELRPWGLHVSLVEPGQILTPIWQKGRSWADGMEQQLTPEAHTRYGHWIRKMRDLTHRAEKIGIPPQAVATQVHHALTARKPRARYVVGRDARAQAVLKRWLPTRRFDAMILKFMGK